MKTNLLVIGALVAITAMAFILPTAASNANAICAGEGSVKACAGGGFAFAQALNAFAKAFNGIAIAGVR